MTLHRAPETEASPVEPIERDPLEPIVFNQRKSRRAPAEGWAVATLTDEHGGRFVCGVQLVDSTAGGVGVTTPMRVLAGSKVVMHFEGQSSPSRWGTVRWCSPDATEPEMFRVGIECDAYERVSA